jgi:epoxide hydrolase 4
MRHETVAANGLEFRCLLAGDPDSPLLLLLHGFPEYSGAWEEIMERLSDEFFCVAPDQRGYGGSSKPAGVGNYAAGKLATDALGILDHYRPGGQAAALVGHDWGASVAYAAAFRAPERIGKLVIANGVHPVPFQRELAKGGAQSEASQYINWLRAEGSEDKLAADGFAGLRRMLDAKMDTSWLTPERFARYAEAWGDAGGVACMVNWYRAAPLVVPKPGETVPPENLPDIPPDAVRVRVPHLLIWGEQDGALLPECIEGLDAFCDDLTVMRMPDADHWILHQRPETCATAIREFVKG